MVLSSGSWAGFRRPRSDLRLRPDVRTGGAATASDPGSHGRRLACTDDRPRQGVDVSGRLLDEAASRLQHSCCRHGSALVEYSEREQRKLHGGRGGVWRLPPSFDGHRRSPLPRFTTLTAEDLDNLHGFFREFGVLLERLLVPGAHVFVASNPLVSYVAADALAEAGLENRGVVTRLVMTMRGGDRPKNAHEEFSGVTVMPRGRTVVAVPQAARGLRSGQSPQVGNRRPAARFGEQAVRRRLAVAPDARLGKAPCAASQAQAFLRQLVRAALPLGKGVVLDPFAGSGSTLAAANHVGYRSIGVELSERYLELAERAMLEAIRCPNTPSCRGACLPCGA